MRIKSINTQKVLGSSDRMLRGSLLVEAVGVSTFAYLLSLLFLYVIPKTPVASLVDADISFGAQPMIIAGTAVIAVIVGVLAGLYPSYYVTSFPPALDVERELRSLACRTPDEKRVSGNPVCGFFHFDYRFFVHVLAKPVYAKCAVRLRQGRNDYRTFEQ